MKRTHVSRTMPVPSSAAFDVLVDIELWPQWGPNVRSATMDDRPMRLGSEGTVTTAVGVRLPYTVTSFVPGRSWAWEVAGIAATDHLVEPLGSTRCRVTFGVPFVATPYLGICAVALRRIELLAVAAAGA